MNEPTQRNAANREGREIVSISWQRRKNLNRLLKLDFISRDRFSVNGQRQTSTEHADADAEERRRKKNRLVLWLQLFIFIFYVWIVGAIIVAAPAPIRHWQPTYIAHVVDDWWRILFVSFIIMDRIVFNLQWWFAVMIRKYVRLLGLNIELRSDRRHRRPRRLSVRQQCVHRWLAGGENKMHKFISRPKHAETAKLHQNLN